jgi:hypothetical protein
LLGWYLPTGHVVHPPDPARAYLPALQVVQLDDLEPEYFPDEQLEHPFPVEN